jgi:hypothetical protein
MIDMLKKYPFECRDCSDQRKNSSGWNSSDVGDVLVFLTAVVGAVVLIAIL